MWVGWMVKGVGRIEGKGCGDSVDVYEVIDFC